MLGCHQIAVYIYLRRLLLTTFQCGVENGRQPSEETLNLIGILKDEAISIILYIVSKDMETGWASYIRAT